MGNYEDFSKFLKLGQYFNVIGCHSGYPVEPIDLPPHIRHLDAYHGFITLTEKAWHAYSLGNGKIEDAIEMICMARGIDKEQLKSEPSIMTVVNTNSPLKVDIPMLDGLMTMAQHGQPVVVTPFTLSGAMSPVTLAGALAQQNAEALGVLSVTQMVNSGTPAMYGGFTSNVDMKSGAPAFGTPEYSKAAMAGGQLARKKPNLSARRPLWKIRIDNRRENFVPLLLILLMRMWWRMSRSGITRKWLVL